MTLLDDHCLLPTAPVKTHEIIPLHSSMWVVQCQSGRMASIINKAHCLVINEHLLNLLGQICQVKSLICSDIEISFDKLS